MIFVSCLLRKRHIFTLDGTCWMVRCSLWVHLLWCGCFPVEALMAICQVMELMLEIKKRDWFKDKGRTKLNYAKLGCKIGFFFGLIVQRKKLHLGEKSNFVVLCIFLGKMYCGRDGLMTRRWWKLQGSQEQSWSVSLCLNLFVLLSINSLVTKRENA
jgi:hypothetical protein